MTVTVKNYSIHEFLTFKIVDSTSLINKVVSTINKQYKLFEVPNDIKDPDITIYLGDFEPSNHDCVIADNKYYIKEDYFYCEDEYKIHKWRFELTGFEKNSIVLRISMNYSAGISIASILIDPLINFSLNKKGYSLVHASCISKNNIAHVFTSQGGGGKTSTALYAVEKGYQFLGDDFVIIYKGIVHSFLSPLNIFSYNLIPLIKNKLKSRYKIEYFIKSVGYKLFQVRIVTKVSVEEVLKGHLTTKAKISNIFLLLANERFTSSELSEHSIIAHMLYNMQFDMVHFTKYMIEYSYVFPNSAFSSFWNVYEQNLKNNLNGNIFFYKIEVPKNYDPDLFGNIYGVIKDAENNKL